MKILTLLRHAKAVEPGGMEDHARPLAARGRHTARLVGEQTVPPDLVLSSDAARTRETVEELVQGWNAAKQARRPRIRYDHGLYLMPPAALLHRLHAVEDEYASAWLVGHNPGLHELARHLASRATGRAAFPKLNERFPTAARAVFALDAESWGELGTAPIAITEFSVAE
jgi:phosphohistidine phosphatase